MKTRRKKVSLLVTLIDSPWWVSIVIGTGAYVLLHWLLPVLAGGNYFLRLLALLIAGKAWIIFAIFLLVGLLSLGRATIANPAFRSYSPGLFERLTKDLPGSGGDRQRPAYERREPGTRAPGAAPQASPPASPAAPPPMPTPTPEAPPTTWSLALLQSLEWKRFEEVCAKLFALRGFRSEATPLGPDGGIDIRLYEGTGEEAVAIVQCKAWGGRPVGVKPVRELLGVMTHEKVGRGFFMAAGGFTEEARQFAATNPLTLITGDMVLVMVNRLSAEDQQLLLHLATAGDYRTPTCPSCGTKMRAVSGREGRPDFWGCPNYPRCRQKLGMRADRPQADLDF